MISAITPFPVPLFHISKEHFFHIVNTYWYVCAVYIFFLSSSSSSSSATPSYPHPRQAWHSLLFFLSLPFFSLFLALTGVIFCDWVTQIGDNSASTIVCRPNCVWRTESARHTYNACLSLFFYGNLAISLAIQFQSVFLYA